MESTPLIYICNNCGDNVRIMDKITHFNICSSNKEYTKCLPCRECQQLIPIHQINDHLLCHELENNADNNDADDDEFYDCQEDFEEMKREEAEKEAYAIKMEHKEKNDKDSFKHKAFHFFFDESSAGNTVLSFIGYFFIGSLYSDIEDKIKDRYNKTINYDLEKLLSLLPVTKLTSHKDLPKDQNNCMICLENFEIDHIVTSLPCTHIYHSDCIVEWLKATNECPICKFQITTSSIFSKDS